MKSIENAQLLNSPVRQISARVLLYEGGTLIATYNSTDALQEIKVERVGDNTKFFGYGICQKVNVKLRDVDKQITYLSTACLMTIEFSVGGGNYFSALPDFYISEVHRDENTNQLSITGYDALYTLGAHPVSNLGLTAPYSAGDVYFSIVDYFGVYDNIVNVTDSAFNLELLYEQGANFNGNEPIRDALDAIAEITQAIYFLNNDGELELQRLDKDGAAVLTIDRESYIELESGDNRRLGTIYSTTELGDDLYVSTDASGSTQYIRDNQFWDLREDRAQLLDAALAAVGGFTIGQFECNWRGNPCVEIGDKIELIAKDGSSIYSYLLDDVIEYDGAYRQKTKWHYEQDERETANNPTSLGEIINQTTATVDKVNREITLVVSETESNEQRLSTLELNTESINSSVQLIQDNLGNNMDSIHKDLETLRTDLTQSADSIKLDVVTEIESNGVSKVQTATGYTFDESGLTIVKEGSEVTTQITENGMTVYLDDDAVLTADSGGVVAKDLHAKTYLIIGNNSRFEDYNVDGKARTGCFWIGG